MALYRVLYLIGPPVGIPTPGGAAFALQQKAAAEAGFQALKRFLRVRCPVLTGEMRFTLRVRQIALAQALVTADVDYVHHTRRWTRTYGYWDWWRRAEVDTNKQLRVFPPGIFQLIVQEVQFPR